MSTDKVSVARYITHQLTVCGKSQIEVASELGYDNPNVITMFKQGRTKVPIIKVKLLAKALGVDPVFLLKLVMTEYMSDTWEVINEILGGTIITAPEEKILSIIQQNSRGLPVEPETDDEIAELGELAQKWSTRMLSSFGGKSNARTVK